LMYVGVLCALEQNYERQTGENFDVKLANIKGFAGTSAGALVCLAMLLRRSVDEISDMCTRMLSSLRSMAPCPDLSLMASRYGLDSGDFMREQIRELLTNAGIRPDTSLYDLHRITGKTLICCATNLHSRQIEYLGPQTTPNLEVVEAVFMSMCVPLLFAPVSYNGNLYVDGFIGENVPTCFEIERTFFFCFDVKVTEAKINSWGDYIESLFVAATPVQKFEQDLRANHSERVLRMNIPGDMHPEFAMKWNLKQITINRFVSCGYLSAMMVLYPNLVNSMESVLNWMVLESVEFRKASDFACEACDSML